MAKRRHTLPFCGDNPRGEATAQHVPSVAHLRITGRTRERLVDGVKNGCAVSVRVSPTVHERLQGRGGTGRRYLLLLLIELCPALSCVPATVRRRKPIRRFGRTLINTIVPLPAAKWNRDESALTSIAIGLINDATVEMAGGRRTSFECWRRRRLRLSIGLTRGQESLASPICVSLARRWRHAG